MASAELSRRVERRSRIRHCKTAAPQRREFHDLLLDAERFEDLPGKWQVAILKAEWSRPKLRLVSDP